MAKSNQVFFVDGFGCIRTEAGVQTVLDFVAHGVCCQSDDGQSRAFRGQNSSQRVSVDFRHLDIANNELKGFGQLQIPVKCSIASEHFDGDFAVTGNLDVCARFSKNEAD